MTDQNDVIMPKQNSLKNERPQPEEFQGAERLQFPEKRVKTITGWRKVQIPPSEIQPIIPENPTT